MSLERIAKEWVLKNVVLSEHADIQYTDVEAALVNLLVAYGAGKHTETGLPELDHTHGADRNGRAAYPIDSLISLPVLARVSEDYPMPVVARYSYGFDEWMIMQGGSSKSVIEWWPIPETGTGIKVK